MRRVGINTTHQQSLFSTFNRDKKIMHNSTKLLIILLHLSLAVSSHTNPSTSVSDATTQATIKSLGRTATTAKKGCQTRCGNLTVKYPFGIGNSSGCSIDPSFDVRCDESFTPPRAFLGNRNYEIVEITDNMVRIKNQVVAQCFNKLGNIVGFDQNFIDIDLTQSPYSFSDSNRFFLVGCDDLVTIVGTNSLSSTTSNCSSSCSSSTGSNIDEGCSVPPLGRHGCCQTQVPKGSKIIHSNSSSSFNHTNVHNFNPCRYTFIGEYEGYRFRAADLSDTNFQSQTAENVTIVLDWAISDVTSCEEAKARADYACKGNSECVSNLETGLGGYRCNCRVGYAGNPYLNPGCTDINECEKDNLCGKHSICNNTSGSYKCLCKYGYTRDDNDDDCIVNNFPVIKFSIGFSIGLLSLFVGITWLYFVIKKRKLARMREKFFHQNGGLLFKQRTSLLDEPTKIFSAVELEKATNNYSEDRILGIGGFGTVFKGIFPDQRVVAVKKSRIMDRSQIEQFINEVIILTRVNHRNVVKLLGCCLETEVPLLVYEFFSNGTLFHHIHNNGESNWFSWKDRLRVATEAAGALSYLHSSASMPIIHRDVKSSNMLLDDSYITKISDFGASRLVSLDRTQVTTLVQGTLGYLDPEYFHTSQLTEKSDVYSFGVVLAELMTGKKPIFPTQSGFESNLATHFITFLKQNRLFHVLDPRVLREGSFEQLQVAGDLVKRCLNLRGDERPTMKEVTIELEGLRRYTKHPWIQHESSEENVALLAQESCSTSDLYSINVDPQSSTDISSMQDSLDCRVFYQSPR